MKTIFNVILSIGSASRNLQSQMPRSPVSQNPQKEVRNPKTIVTKGQALEAYPTDLNKRIEKLRKTNTLQKASCEIVRILQIISFCQFDSSVTECLWKIEQPKIKNQRAQWESKFVKCLVEFFHKLPALRQVYKNAMKMTLLPAQSQFTHLFRLVNHLSMLFPTISYTIELVRKYYHDQYPSTIKLFHVLRNFLIFTYQYLKLSFDEIFLNHENFQPAQLKTFLNSLSDFQLFIDRMQQYLYAKIFKVRKAFSRISFKEQDIEKLKFYLLKITEISRSSKTLVNNEYKQRFVLIPNYKNISNQLLTAKNSLNQTKRNIMNEQNTIEKSPNKPKKMV